MDEEVLGSYGSLNANARMTRAFRSSPIWSFQTTTIGMMNTRISITASIAPTVFQRTVCRQCQFDISSKPVLKKLGRVTQLTRLLQKICLTPMRSEGEQFTETPRIEPTPQTTHRTRSPSQTIRCLAISGLNNRRSKRITETFARHRETKKNT